MFYLSTIDVFHGGFPEEEIDVIFVLHGAHEIRRWKKKNEK